MSRFFSKKYASLEAYTPGEQPKERKYIKLNTNESPFPPSEDVSEEVLNETKKTNLYCDPECTELTAAVANYYGVQKENVLMTNGSDEILNFAFMAFGDGLHPFVFPDITYGFYPVFAQVNNIPYKELPVRENLSIDINDYINAGCNIVIANPNAPTGLVLNVCDIEKIVKTNPDNIVIIDEAYIDFGGETSLPLIEKYDNLLITRTFSKSFSLAGARLGFGMGNSELIKDLNTVKYSTNPYNVNRMTQTAGKAAINSADYYMKNCAVISENREFTKKELLKRGFNVTDSKANFLFVSHSVFSGQEIYEKLRQNGILVRHFSTEKICNFNRITVGTREQMTTLINTLDIILKGG